MFGSNKIKSHSAVRDTGEQLKRRILSMLLIRTVLFTLLIAVTYVLQTMGSSVILPPPAVIMAFISVVFIFSIGSAARLQNKTHHIPRFALFQLLYDALFAALLVYGTGCSQSIFTPVLIFPVIIGGLNLYRIGGLLAASGSTILYGTILTCEYLGYIPAIYAEIGYVPRHDLLPMSNLFAVYGITFFTIALLSSLLAGRLRRAEENLTTTSRRLDSLNLLYKQIFDDISTGIITVDNENFITSCNRATEEITGFSADEVVGQPFFNFFSSILLADTEQICQATNFKTRDEQWIRIRYSATRLDLPSNLQINEPGSADSKVITIRDISQLEKMEKQVRDAEKMAAIGELSAAIAHDFRNPLASISGSAQILAMEADEQENEPSSTSRSLTDIILRESARMEKTITEFLQFARPTAITPQWFNLKLMLDETVSQLIEIHARCQKCTVTIDIRERFNCWGDRQQVQTIILHLLENSCTATCQNNPAAIIRAAEKKVRGTNYLCIQVIDRGAGIPKSLREQIFTPFFSTREDSTGLGLSIVKMLVEQHKGIISIPDDRESGCLVEVCFPLPEENEE